MQLNDYFCILSKLIFVNISLFRNDCYICQLIWLLRMKKKLLKLLFISLFMLSSSVMFSQGDDNGDGTLEGDDPPAAPINSGVSLLLFAGTVLAIYTFKVDSKLKNNCK